MAYYIENKETGKIELHFEKVEYQALSNEQKLSVKSNFLFSRYSGAWVSRCKFPNLYWPRKVAEDLGLEDAGKTGERLTFEEQQERKAERAERRAERMETRAEKAMERGEALQKPINDRHGDIAFFTQPNINSSAGRAFTKQRNRMWDAWERGWDEFKKSEYYADRAETARKTAANTKPKDKGFCQRRINEAESNIRKLRKSISEYESYRTAIENGETPKDKYGWEVKVSVEQIENEIERWSEIMEQEMEKSIYYHDCMEELGGVSYSKENIKPGFVVTVRTGWAQEPVTVISAGAKNIKYKTASGFVLTASYAEIKSVVKAEESEKKIHPYKVGETFTCDRYNPAGKSFSDRFEKVTYKVIKVTDKTITLQVGDEKPFTRKPTQRHFMTKGEEWYVCCNDLSGSCWTKTVA